MKWGLIAGAAFVVLFLVWRKFRSQQTLAAGQIPPPIPMNPAQAKTSPSLEQQVAEFFGVPGARFIDTSNQIANKTVNTIPGGKYIAAVAAPVTLGPAILGSFFGGSSKILRAKNGKDVFPNDLRNCRDFLGITDANACGMTYNTTTKQWPRNPWPK